MKYQALNDQVLVRFTQHTTRSILLPDDSKSHTYTIEVLSIGQLVTDSDIHLGDIIYVSPSCNPIAIEEGMTADVDNSPTPFKLCFINSGNIIGKQLK